MDDCPVASLVNTDKNDKFLNTTAGFQFFFFKHFCSTPMSTHTHSPTVHAYQNFYFLFCFFEQKASQHPLVLMTIKDSWRFLAHRREWTGAESATEDDSAVRGRFTQIHTLHTVVKPRRRGYVHEAYSNHLNS